MEKSRKEAEELERKIKKKEFGVRDYLGEIKKVSFKVC